MSVIFTSSSIFEKHQEVDYLQVFEDKMVEHSGHALKKKKNNWKVINSDWF